MADTKKKCVKAWEEVSRIIISRVACINFIKKCCSDLALRQGLNLENEMLTNFTVLMYITSGQLNVKKQASNKLSPNFSLSHLLIFYFLLFRQICFYFCLREMKVLFSDINNLPLKKTFLPWHLNFWASHVSEICERISTVHHC